MSEQRKFNDWLKQRRKERGIGQEELADRVGVSFAMLRKIESGERRPSGQVAALLADYFRVPDDEREAFVAFARTGSSASPIESVEVKVPWRGAHLRHANLPALLTPLIGRDQEIQAGISQLQQSRTRLLSMIGPPGVGKTRLALQVAAELGDELDDGVLFVDLSPVIDPEQVLPTIAAALGLTQTKELQIEGALLGYIRERRMLLLLDNFEQVLDAAADIVRLLEASPWLKVLITSREALYVRGERRFPVPPLGLPDPKQIPSPAAMSSYPSIALFVERAQAVAPDFKLTKDNAADIAEVCIGLEGLPLAIELAAARARHLTPREMRLALTSRLNWLAPGGRDLPARHRTLISAIEWSYGLLSSSEQTLFRKLSVFVGGFTADIADTVAGNNAGTQATLEALADKNLLKVERHGDTRRFGMLETIREYANSQLQKSGEAASTQQRHAEAYLALVGRARSMEIDKPEAIRYTGLELEQDNMRAALDWFLSGAESQPNSTVHDAEDTEANIPPLTEPGLRMLVELVEIWKTRNYYTECRRWLDRAIEFIETRLWNSDGQLGVELNADLQPLVAKTFYEAGWILVRQGDFLTAQEYLKKAINIYRMLEDKEHTAFALHRLALATSETGGKTEAREMYEESLALQRETGMTTLIGSTLNNLGILYRGAGDPATARGYLEQRLVLAREQGDARGLAAALDNLGLVALDLEDFADARRYQDEALPIFRDLGNKWDLAESLSFVGMREVEERNYKSAWNTYIESLDLFKELGSKLGVAKGLSGLACIFARTGKPMDAARLWGAIEVLRIAINSPLPPANRPRIERHIAAARAQADPATFEQAWDEGRKMSADDALTYALSRGGLRRSPF